MSDAFDQLDQQQSPPQTTTVTTTPAPTPSSATSVQTPTTGDAFDQLEAQQKPAPAKPVISPEEKASQLRQSLVSGLTGMPTPNMTPEDREQFEKGKAAGAISVPVVAGATTGATAIAEALPSVLIHTVEGVKALGAWAEAHPYKAFMLYQVAKELLPGAKKAMGFIKAAPTGE